MFLFFSDIVGTAKISVIDMVGNYGALGLAVLERVKRSVGSTGVGISNFIAENIALPPEVRNTLIRKFYGCCWRHASLYGISGSRFNS